MRALLRPTSAARAPRLLDAIASYLDLYQPLLGAYPYSEFTVVENFFSSGFAFPGFTLLSSQVIEMGERGLRPGYLDHELLHNWWGNGVLASRRSGHWAEALATYCANYMRPVLEGRSEQGRAQRRSVAETLSGDPVLRGAGGRRLRAGRRGLDLHRLPEGSDDLRPARVAHRPGAVVGRASPLLPRPRRQTEQLGRSARRVRSGERRRSRDLLHLLGDRPRSAFTPTRRSGVGRRGPAGPRRPRLPRPRDDRAPAAPRVRRDRQRRAGGSNERSA